MSDLLELLGGERAAASCSRLMLPLAAAWAPWRFRVRWLSGYGQAMFGHPMVYGETSVERDFQGACFRAADVEDLAVAWTTLSVTTAGGCPP